jgi:hypothetical protein
MHNPAVEFSQSQKRKILAEDRDRMASYLDHARASADDDRGGRFAAASPNRTVIGTAPIAYPQQPSTSPSNQMAMMPDEPPLGYSVNDQEPTGEAFEVAASIGTSPAAEDVADVGGGLPQAASGRPATPKLRRRL